MFKTNQKTTSYLAVLLLVVTVFFVSGLSFSGKTALGSSGFNSVATLENTAANPLAALAKKLASPIGVLGNSNGTEGNLPEGYTPLKGIGADVNNSDLPSGYIRVADPDGYTKISSPKGDIYDSIDDLPVPSGYFRGKYESNLKHDFAGRNVSPQPSNPISVLEDSVPLGGNSSGRIGYDSLTKEIVVFQNHFGDSFHGYVPQWSDLTQRQKNALIKAGLFKPNGKSK